MAEDRWKGTMRNIDFDRVDLAFVDYNVTINILVQSIPDNKDYPELCIKKQQYDTYLKLRNVGLWCIQAHFALVLTSGAGGVQQTQNGRRYKDGDSSK